eukprot:TRINITY_DN87203_c0_g1_i1.p3 TRINITY_DN87203_c0_g1~~TRINITY_DN87203_c0_g1_i1.p3  ORF type:complete len:108 (+),score=21.07 TRINITY_DN87203_c0_g1_i1:51-374(+)
MAEEGKAETGGQESPEKAEQEESGAKKCCYALLDCIAVVVRTIVAILSGIKWATQRCCYPMKESVITCLDRWSVWYTPASRKKPARVGTPSLSIKTSKTSYGSDEYA